MRSQMKLCGKCQLTKPLTEFYLRHDTRKTSYQCKKCAKLYQQHHKCKPSVIERVNQWNREYTKKKPEKRLLIQAKQRAKRLGVPCTITEDCIVIPSHCPILGIQLQVGSGKFHDASPSLDRLTPQLGYVPGNVAVISYRANTVKNNASAQELRMIADWIDKRQTYATVPT